MKNKVHQLKEMSIFGFVTNLKVLGEEATGGTASIQCLDIFRFPNGNGLMED